MLGPLLYLARSSEVIDTKIQGNENTFWFILFRSSEPMLLDVQ